MDAARLSQTKKPNPCGLSQKAVLPPPFALPVEEESRAFLLEKHDHRCTSRQAFWLPVQNRLQLRHSAGLTPDFRLYALASGHRVTERDGLIC
jgi:hypothetical protein